MASTWPSDIARVARSGRATHSPSTSTMAHSASGMPLAPDHVEDRGARVDVEIDAVAGARLGRKARGEGGEQLERDPHAAPAAER